MSKRFNIIARVTENEKQEVEFMAKQKNMNMSDFIRDRIFCDKPMYDEIQKEIVFYSYCNTLLISHLLGEDGKDGLIQEIKTRAKEKIEQKYIQ